MPSPAGFSSSRVSPAGFSSGRPSPLITPNYHPGDDWPEPADEETPLYLHSAMRKHGVPSMRDSGRTPLVFDAPRERAYLPSRVLATLEAIAAKVFWDGFAWERFGTWSIRRLHCGPTTWTFALMTGLGASCGLFCGQSVYAALVWAAEAWWATWRGERSPPTPKSLLFGLQFSALLALAASVSGTAWQPVVNGLTAALGPLLGDPGQALFAAVAACTALVHGLDQVFFLALHAFRWALAGGARFEAVDDAFTESSLVYDATLALSVGGAGGCFVFTEQALASNPLTSVFGVTDATPPLAGAVRAGAAYAVGFMAVQAVQVLLFPANTTWSDVRKKGREQLTKTRESVLLPYRTPFG